MIILGEAILLTEDELRTIDLLVKFASEPYGGWSKKFLTALQEHDDKLLGLVGEVRERIKHFDPTEDL